MKHGNGTAAKCWNSQWSRWDTSYIGTGTVKILLAASEQNEHTFPKVKC